MPKPRKVRAKGQEPPHPARERQLTDQQELFCQRYIISLNATKAAKEANYSEKNAHVLGYQLLQNPLVEARLAELKRKRAKKLNITQERVLREIAALAFSRVSDVVEVRKGGRISVKATDEWNARSHIAVAEISETINDSGGSTKIKMHDKLGALRDLANHVGLFDKDAGEDQDDRGDALDDVCESLQKVEGRG